MLSYQGGEVWLGEKKCRPFMKNGELSETARASKQCRGVAGVQRREEAALRAAGERLHLVVNEPLTGSDVLISSVCFHRPLRVHSTIVLLGRPYRRSQALGPYLSSDCPVFFLCLEFMGLNIIFLLAQSLASWQTVLLSYIGKER